MDIRVRQITVSPLKSGRITARREIIIGRVGPTDDRRVALVDNDGQCITQRRRPELALILAKTMSKTGMSFQAMPSSQRQLFTKTLELPPRAFEGGDDREMTLVSGERVMTVDLGDRAAEWFSGYLGEPCRLVRLHPFEPRIMEDDTYPCALQDGYSVSVLSAETVLGLNNRLPSDAQVTAKRFRMTILIQAVDGPGEPHFEDRIREMRIGGICFEWRKWTPRCVMVNVNEDTGATDNRILRTLATYRTFNPSGNKPKVLCGGYYAHRGGSIIRVNDPVEVLDWQDPPQR